jgi:hypothetical protein
MAIGSFEVRSLRHTFEKGGAMATAHEVAQWMVDRVEEGRLRQDSAARRIRAEFGEEFTYKNKNHNWAIRKEVLDAFNELTGDEVVWSKGDRLWRKRGENDKPGRQQR